MNSKPTPKRHKEVSKMANNNEVKTNDTVDFEYQGFIYTITKEEYEALREGWVTVKEMFE